MMPVATYRDKISVNKNVLACSASEYHSVHTMKSPKVYKFTVEMEPLETWFFQ